MPHLAATIESLPMAFALVKKMQADGIERGEGSFPLGLQALTEIIQGRVAEAVDYWLDSLDDMAMRDRRNGHYTRWLMTGFGDIEHCGAPRTLPFRPAEVLKSCAEIERAIPAGYVPSLSSRKVSEVLLPLLSRPRPQCLRNNSRTSWSISAQLFPSGCSKRSRKPHRRVACA